MSSHEQNVPDQHSNLVGGSTAARRIACRASYALELQVPEVPGGAAAREGTALHEMMTKLLLDAEIEPYDLLPFEFTHKEGWSYTITDQIWEDLGQPALDAFMDYMEKIEAQTGATFEYMVEQKCEFPGIPGAFGTSDVVWKCGTVSGVWDWKFGYGAVSADENKQLLFYAAGARATYPHMFADAREIELVIMQPQRSHEPDVWIIYEDRLDEFVLELQTAVREVQLVAAGSLPPEHVKGDHCKFARCKSICPLHVNPTLALAKKLGVRLDDEEQAKEDGEPLGAHEAFEGEETFVDMLPAMLELAEVAREYANHVFEHAQALAINDPVALAKLQENGWGLKAKRDGNEAWVVSADKVKSGLSRRGLKIDEYAPRKLVTPTQAKKLIAKAGLKEVPEDWSQRPKSDGATLTRLKDGMPEYKTRADRALALAKRLGVDTE